MSRVLSLIVAVALTMLLASCSLSAEQKPRPINRETTVATIAPAAP